MEVFGLPGMREALRCLLLNAVFILPSVARLKFLSRSLDALPWVLHCRLFPHIFSLPSNSEVLCLFAQESQPWSQCATDGLCVRSSQAPQYNYCPGTQVCHAEGNVTLATFQVTGQVPAALSSLGPALRLRAAGTVRVLGFSFLAACPPSVP